MNATHRLVGIISLLALIASARLGASAGDPLTLTGVAVDASGAALPGVTVTVTPAGQASAEPFLEVTNETGEFGFADLGPGVYEVILSLPGFDEKRLSPVVVPASSAFRVVLEIAGLAETVVVRVASEPTSVDVPAGTANIEERVLRAMPLATDRFEEALPLLPGTVRGPDGLLNMKGGRADQSALLVNGVNMTDPVTGHFAVRLPIEAVESLKVQGGVMSAAVGDATAGVTDVVIRSGSDTRTFQFQNFMPRPRFANGRVRGIDAFTPRVHVAGPIQPGRLWYSQALNYRFVRTRVNELTPYDESEQKVQSFDSLTQIDYAANASHHLATTFVWFPSNIDNAGLDTLHPHDATPDLTQRGWGATVSDRSVLSSRMTLATTVAVKQFDMAVTPKFDTASLVTVGGTRSNYFNRFDRNSRRYDASSTLTLALDNGIGNHLLNVGGQVAHVTFDGVDAGQPIHVMRANGAPASAIEFIGSPAVGASNTEVASFLEDKWSINRRVTLQTGVRYAHEGIAAESTVAPRIEASVRPFSGDRTVVKGGVGQFYDKLPLNADGFERQQSRLVTEFAADGAIVGSPVRFDNQLDPAGLRTPTTRTWNIEVDQAIAMDVSARVAFSSSRGSSQLVVDPIAAQGALALSSNGRTQTRQLETTLHRKLQGGEINVSYVRASTKGDLNDFVSLFGDLRDPIIRANEFSLQAFDVPNRFLAWGVLTLPHTITIAPTVEYRNGFPYTVVDQDQRVVGSRNRGGRFPNLFTADIAVTKDVVLPRKQRARVGVQLFNLTGHSNPRDVQNNIDSPEYRQFANSVDRQVRAKFTLLF